jgi:hypothetical protein
MDVPKPPRLDVENFLAWMIFREARQRPERSAFGDVMDYQEAVIDRLFRMHAVPAHREREVWEKLMALRPFLWWKPQSRDYEF